MSQSDANTSTTKGACGPSCSKNKRCPFYSVEFCVEKGRYCYRHCPCKKGTYGRTKKIYNTKKENCHTCDPKRSRCPHCRRCLDHCKGCLLKTPPPVRSNRTEVMEGIHDAQAKTPFEKKLEFGEFEIDKESQLFGLLGMDQKAYHNLPKQEIRKGRSALDQIHLMKNAERASDELALVMQRATEEIAKVLLPHDSEWLENQLYLRLCKSYGSKDEKMRVKILEGFAQDLIDLVKKMPRHTVAYRTARAIIVNNVGQTKLSTLFEDLDPPTIGSAGRRQGKLDMLRAKTEQLDPLKNKRSTSHMPQSTVVRMVKHVLSNVQTLSWGTKSLKVNGRNKWIDFPKLTRTGNIKLMMLDFAREEAHLKAIDWDDEDEDKTPPHRTTYYEVCSALTSKAEKSISCIDYVQDILINSRMTGLTQIIDDLVAPTQKEELKDHLRVVQHFLKYQYDGHLSYDDEICSHNLHHALGLKPKSGVEIKGNEHCPGCKYVEYFMQEEFPDIVELNRSKANSASVDDAKIYIQDSLDGFKLYKNHRARVVNQQHALAQIDVELQIHVMRTKRRGTTIKAVIDFKQKYLEKRLRSSQMNDFGQRGITWHIVVIEYWVYEEPCEANDFKGDAVRVQVPLDQLLNSGNKQDGPCVLAMMEALMKFIELELPFVEDVVIISDNAPCYHSKELIFSICVLNQLSNGPKIVKYIHPETQDGKGACDSHAAVAGTHVDRHFICARKDGTLTYNQACTPTEVATALCSDGGVKNSAVQLIKLDFDRLELISKLCHGASEAAKEYFARANEIRFFPELDGLASWASLDLIDESNWSEMEPLIQVINYSNISEGGVFRVGFRDWENKEGTFEHVVSPAEDPEWYTRMKISGVASKLVGSSMMKIVMQTIGQSIGQHSMAQVAAAQAGQSSIVAQAWETFMGSLNHDDEGDDKSVSDDDACDDDVFEIEDDDEVEENSDVANQLIESFYEIEHMARTSTNDDDEFDDDQEEESSYFHDESGDIEEDEEAADEPFDGRNEATNTNARPSALQDPPARYYNQEGFFTFVKVEKHKPLGALLPTKSRQTSEKKDGDEEEYESRKAVDRAILLAHQYINQQVFSIRPSTEENIKLYEEADDWSPPSLILGQGWARRPTSGLYGVKYMNDEFKEIIQAQFERGERNKGDKQSASQTLELIREKHPGLYCYPGVHEILRIYSSMVSKKNDKDSGKRAERDKEPPTDPIIKKQLQDLVNEHPDKTAKPIIDLWVTQYGGGRLLERKEILKLRTQAQYFRSKRKYNEERDKKRNKCG